MIQNFEATPKGKLDQVMETLLRAVKKLKPGDNQAMECPVCGGELIVYKPFKKRVAARCKSDNCLKIWD